jgi:hypothetical protein
LASAHLTAASPLPPPVCTVLAHGCLVLDGFFSSAFLDGLRHHLWSSLPIAPKDKPSPIDRSYFADVEGWMTSHMDSAIQSALMGCAAAQTVLPAEHGADGPVWAAGPSQGSATLIATLGIDLPSGAVGGGLVDDVTTGGESFCSPDPAQQDPAQPDPAQPDPASPNPTQPDTTQLAPAAVSPAAVAGLGGLKDQAADLRMRVATAPLARFLCYASAGGGLPAHVDLARTWSGLRSSHSFLLYLTDCGRGGETLLLESLPGDSAVGVVPGPRRTLERVAPNVGRLLLMPHGCPHAAAPVIDAPKLLLRGEALVASHA